MLTTKVCSTIAVAAGSAMVERKKTMAFATMVAAKRRLQISIVCNFDVWSVCVRCTSI